MYDEIIRERPRLAVELNPLFKTGAVGDLRFGHGFQWMTALARIELGAILALFTEVKTPFAVFDSPTQDRANYRELLVSGFQQHYAEMQADDSLADALRRKFQAAPQQALSVTRRLIMTVAMSRHAVDTWPDSFTETQLQQVGQQFDDAQQALQQMGTKLQKVVGRNEVRIKKYDLEFAAACGSAVTQIRSELRMGIANFRGDAERK